MSEKVTADCVFGKSRRANDIILSRWKELLRNNSIYNAKLREAKTSVFQEILNRIGTASRTRIESEPEYLGDCYIAANEDNKYHPFNLLRLIRNTHIAFTGSNFVNPDVARAGFTERLHNMTQGNDSPLDYMKRLLELRDEELVFAENNKVPSKADPTVMEIIRVFPDEKPLALRFMDSLNSRHTEVVNKYRNNLNEGKPVFSTVQDACTFVNLFVSSNNVSMKQLSALVAQASQGVKHKKNGDKQRDKRRVNEKKLENAKPETSPKGDANNNKNLKDCWFCRNLKVGGDIKHYYPNDCPSNKACEKITGKKRKNTSDSNADANSNAANAFLDENVGIKRRKKEGG
jgi:hypothetical protein